MAARKKAKRGDHIILRGSTYFYRRQIPAALRDVLGHELVRSLRTSDVVVARTRSTRVNLEVDLLLEAARSNAWGEVEAARGVVDEVITRYQREEVLADRDKRNRLRDPDAGESNPDAVNVPELLDERHADGWLPVEETLAALKESGVSMSAAQVGDLLNAMKDRGVVTARMEVEKDRARAQRFEVLPTLSPSVAAPVVHSSPALGGLVDKYVAEKTAHGWAMNTARDNKTVLRVFVERVGADREVGSVTEDDVLEWRDVGLKGDLTGTVRTKVKNIQAFFNHCVRRDHIVKSPAKGLAPKAVDKRSGKARRAYTTEELAALFGADLVVKGVKRPDHWWIPVVALYSGLRQTEAAQLGVRDLVTRKGVLCFEVREGLPGQRVKNPDSFRTVPVHRHLIQLGIQEFHKEREAAGETFLWPNVGLGAKGKGMGSRVSQAWTRWSKKHDVETSEQVCFHSMRHNFGQALTDADVADSTVAQLMGHKDKSMTTGNYGKRFEADKLQRAVELLDFSEVHALRSIE